MKILIIALSGIGDGLMFTPALKLLRKQLPDSQIDALVMYNGSAELLKNDPHLNKVYHFDFMKEGLRKSLGYILELRNKYDATINVYPSNRKEYNIISFLIGAKKRAGIKYLRKDIQNFGFLNNVRVTEDDTVHNVQTNIKLCEKLSGKRFETEPPLEIFIEDKHREAANEFLSKTGIKPGDIVIGFHPGCATLKNHIKRRWEPEKFAGLGKRLIENHKAKILIFGGPDEAELKESIKENINSPEVLVIKADSILQSAAIIEHCKIFITNDSSQMHIASALKCKVVAIIGPTNKNYIYPWKTDYKIVSLNLDCSPCFFYSPRALTCTRKDVKFKCIKEIDVDMVYDQVKYYLNE
jgi:heptosyltransferase-2